MKKRNLLLAAVLLCCAVGLVSAALSLRSDAVTNRYSTIAQTHSAQLFERGWLPDILPPSTYAILTFNNLDLNTSVGEFSFAPADYSLLATSSQPYKTNISSFASIEQDI